MKRVSSALIGLLLASFAGAADTKTATSQATLAVLPDCTVSATDLDLGVYNYRTGASGQAKLKLTCNVATMTLTVSQSDTAQFVGQSNSSGRSFALGRHLTQTTPAAETIPYDVSVALPDFLVAGFGNRGYVAIALAGNGTANLTNPLNNLMLNISASVKPGEWKPAGRYEDLITFTLDYTP